MVQVPLERLNERLTQHAEKLKAELVDVINADYSSFMGLSEQLGSVDGAVLRMSAPLLKLKESLDNVQERHQAELQSLRDCLDRRSQARLPRHPLPSADLGKAPCC